MPLHFGPEGRSTFSRKGADGESRGRLESGGGTLGEPASCISANDSYLSRHVIDYLKSTSARQVQQPAAPPAEPGEPSSAADVATPAATHVVQHAQRTLQNGAAEHLQGGDGEARCKSAGCKFKPNFDEAFLRKQPKWAGFCCAKVAAGSFSRRPPACLSNC